MLNDLKEKELFSIYCFIDKLYSEKLFIEFQKKMMRFDFANNGDIKKFREILFAYLLALTTR